VAWDGAAPPGGAPAPGQPAPGQPYPQQPFPAQAQQPPPQPTIAAAPGYPPGYQANVGPQQPGFMHALSAPPGTVKVLWLGVILMVVSFMAKQILVDITLQPITKLMEDDRLRSKQSAEIEEIDAALDEVRNEIASLDDEGKADEFGESGSKYKPPRASARSKPSFGEDPSEGAPPPSADEVAEEAKRKEKAEKMEKLATKRADLEKTLQPKRKKVRDEYRPKIAEAKRDSVGAQASMVGRFQTSLTVKLIVDLLKLFGATMVVFSALRISTDPDQNTGTKAYAAVLGGIAFVSMVIGGVYSALFG
jgi:hypothetical protein